MLGGNLTYPALKLFRNSFGVIVKVASGSPPAAGVAGQEFRLLEDKKLYGAAGARVLFIESEGAYMPGGANASVTRIDHADSVAKVENIVLEDRGPNDESTHELGFTVVAKAQHPGVMNDNRYGQRRTYAHKFDVLDPVSGGLISDADLMRAYSGINQQITDDSGRFNGHMQGNIEAVVDAVTALTFSGDISGDTFDVPAAGLYGQTLAACSDYISSPATISAGALTVGNTVVGESYIVVANSVALSMYVGQSVTIAVAAPTGAHTITRIVKGATNSYIYLDTVWTTAAAATFATAADTSVVNNSAVEITYPGYGFIVHPAAETISSHVMTLNTKSEYQNLSTFNVEKLDGVFTNVVPGNFELLPWAEVFREFSHMAHDVPLSNHHAIDKPANTYNWTKFHLTTSHRNAGFHGASESGSYLEEAIVYVPDNLATTGVAGCVDDLEALFVLWATA